MNLEIKNKKRIASRKDLIALFERGRLPTAEHFERLINSNFNKVDDRLDIDEDNGIMIYPVNKGKLLSFFKRHDDEDAKYILSVSEKGICIKEVTETRDQGESILDKKKEPNFFIEEGSGKIGIGTSEPAGKLDIKGIVASHGRIGNFKEGMLPADGRWHNVFEKNLTNVHAFEVMSYARSKKGKGMYSLLHATALNTFGKSKITKTCAHFGKLNNRIEIRWVSRLSSIQEGIPKKDDKQEETVWLLVRIYKKIIVRLKRLTEPKLHEYNLQLRTMCHYGLNNPEFDSNDIKLFYKISVLWNPDIMPRKSDIDVSNRMLSK